MKKTIEIKGMHCVSCSKLIEMELEDQVNKISVNHETGKAEIDFDENKISEHEINQIIKKSGFSVKGGQNE